MAYPCPHCQQPVRRCPTSSGFDNGGLVAALLGSAMADFECTRCGIILREEFSPEVQRQMTRGSYTMIVIGALLAAVVAAGALYYNLQ
jgi:hypothetical protein